MRFKLTRLLLIASCLAAPAAAQFDRSPERQAATEADYRETLARFGIEHMRPGADGFDKQSPNAANYDEGRAGRTTPLPPLLDVAQPAASWWWKVRRPQLVRLLEDEMYGRVPETAPKIDWQMLSEERAQKYGVPVIARRYRGSASGTPLAIDLSVTLPERAAGAVPLILELGFPEGFRFPGAPIPADPWMAQVLRRGWAYAIIVPSTVQPDDGAGLKEGLIGAAARGKPRGEHDWGALRAWAWGASRALDLFASGASIDPKRVAVEGLSRYGKAALVTMAFDQRFSLGFIGSSGAGGAKLLRRDFGERVENLTASGEYHWFSPTFVRYGGPRTVDDLPVDAHSLIALVAPRPLFIGAGNFEQDGWVDPRGSFLAAKKASTAYRLLGVPGLVADSPPALNVGATDGCIAFRQHDQGHTNGPNWPAFLDFAQKVWSGRPRCSGKSR